MFVGAIPGEVLYTFYFLFFLDILGLLPATDETTVTAVGDKSLITSKMEK